MNTLYDTCALKCSRLITGSYSTSFSLASSLLDRSVRDAIHSIYGFVRLADEIVDTFHGTEQGVLLDEFESETRQAIARGISLNPILHSFQRCVRNYAIEWELIEAFLISMRADLAKKEHDRDSFDTYVYGSAEVVGLMCLRVFVDGDESEYRRLTPSARALGSAFQQVNFLRDINHDFSRLGRSYFPSVKPNELTAAQRSSIEQEIAGCFDEALLGIRQLPPTARLGVYVAFRYYNSLFKKLRALPTNHLLQKRVRVSDWFKVVLLFKSWIRYQVNAL